MEDEPVEGAEGTDAPEPEVDIPSLPSELQSGEDEIRRMVDAGASSPDELRSLAARLREQRLLEESAWRREVKPALIESKKRRISVRDLRDRPGGGSEGEGPGIALIALLVAGALILTLIAAQTTIIWLLVPVFGVLVYAYVKGRESMSSPDPNPDGPTAPPDPAD